MSSSFFDVAARALATERSRRGAFSSLVTVVLAALPGVSAARENERNRRQDRNRRNRHGKRKGGGKGKRNGCQNRHSERQILGFIAKAANKYGQSQKAMERVARCESGLDPCAVNRSGPYYGLFQFLKSTWKSTPYRDRSIWDPEAQALATAWMWKKGRKNEWACQ